MAEYGFGTQPFAAIPYLAVFADHVDKLTLKTLVWEYNFIVLLSRSLKS